MRKTPSYLKGLAETRARAAGDVERFSEIRDDVMKRLAAAQSVLASCDRLIEKYDTRLDPNLIKPIHAWQGRYGKRGALRTYIHRVIQEAWPEEITTAEVAWSVQIEFQIHFDTWQQKKHWKDKSVLNTIHSLLKEGVVERLHDAERPPTGEVGRWRWKKDSYPSLDHLRALAEESGVVVQQCDDGPS